MSLAADGHPSVKALVYIASFILENGESTGELADKFPGAQLGPALQTVKYPLPDGALADDLYIQQDQFRRVFAADVDEETARLMAATQRPIAAAALAAPATKTAWKTIPSWNMVTLQDLAIRAVDAVHGRTGAVTQHRGRRLACGHGIPAHLRRTLPTRSLHRREQR